MQMCSVPLLSLCFFLLLLCFFSSLAVVCRLCEWCEDRVMCSRSFSRSGFGGIRWVSSRALGLYDSGSAIGDCVHFRLEVSLKVEDEMKEQCEGSEKKKRKRCKRKSNKCGEVLKKNVKWDVS
ncbi:hypothetical protein VNO80_14249 [Phaseolus coccineus]|uniref:Secreted protein n=1 Tax=Phaseolus coccineus TaxID=3886 RepID=A0AAN9MI27_PHACN